MNDVKDLIHLIKAGKAQEAGLALESIVAERAAIRRSALVNEADGGRDVKIKSKLKSLVHETFRAKTPEEYEAKRKDLEAKGFEYEPSKDKLELRILSKADPALENA